MFNDYFKFKDKQTPDVEERGEENDRSQEP